MVGRRGAAPRSGPLDPPYLKCLTMWSVASNRYRAAPTCVAFSQTIFCLPVASHRDLAAAGGTTSSRLAAIMSKFRFLRLSAYVIGSAWAMARLIVSLSAPNAVRAVKNGLALGLSQ